MDRVILLVTGEVIIACALVVMAFAPTMGIVAAAPAVIPFVYQFFQKENRA